METITVEEDCIALNEVIEEIEGAKLHPIMTSNPKVVNHTPIRKVHQINHQQAMDRNHPHIGSLYALHAIQKLVINTVPYGIL